MGDVATVAGSTHIVAEDGGRGNRQGNSWSVWLTFLPRERWYLCTTMAERRRDAHGGLGVVFRGLTPGPPYFCALLPSRPLNLYHTLRLRHRSSGRVAKLEGFVTVDAPVRRRGRSPVARRLEQIPASGIRRFFDLAPDVISLSIGQPDYVTPSRIVDAAHRALDAGHTGYTSNSGLLELREAVTVLLRRLYGLDYDPESEVLITTGVSEGLNVAFQALLDTGDEVLVPEPSYVAYAPNIELPGGRMVTVPTAAADGFRPKIAALEAAVTSRTKVLMLGYPSNPTGAVLLPEDIAALSAFVERHDLFVVADEIYDRLTYGVTHQSFAAAPGMRDRTLLLGGFSKAYAMTGWRLGWLAAPPDILEGVMRIHQYVMMSAPTLSQHAAIEAALYAEEDVQLMVAGYARRRALLVEGLNRIGLSCPLPMGAFYAFPNISVTGMSDLDFCDRLLTEERVAVVPGSAFGPSGRGHVRVCYAADDRDITEALARIDRFVRRNLAAIK